MESALLNRLTHHSPILEMNGETYRFRESMKTKEVRNAECKDFAAIRCPSLPKTRSQRHYQFP